MLDLSIFLEPSVYQTAAIAVAALIAGLVFGRFWRRSLPMQLDDTSAWQLARQMASELRRIDVHDTVPAVRTSPALANSNTDGGQGRPLRVRLFIDLPNFEMNWKAFNRGRVRVDAISWQNLPQVLIDELPVLLGVKREQLCFAGAELYESYIPYQLLALHGEDHKADTAYFYRRRRFLETDVALIPGYAVHISDRTLKFEDGTPTRNADGDLQSNEKGVDTSLISHLFLHASADTYDVALLLSEDSDYVPAVRALQTHFNKRVIHVGFKRRPHGISGSVWGDIVIDRTLTRKLSQPSKWFSRTNKPDENTGRTAAARAPQSAPVTQAETPTSDDGFGDDIPETTRSLDIGAHYNATVRKVSRHGLRISVENGPDLVRIMPSFQTVQPFLQGKDIEQVFQSGQKIEVKVVGRNQKGNPLISVVSILENPTAA